ncbi:hypothetical protein LguiA_011381 [Lonicera macranthoides]
MMQGQLIISLSLSLFLIVITLLISLGILVNIVIALQQQEFRRDDFPADFVFGSGSSAYQVEGAAFEDGRTPSIWDTFAHSGRSHGATGDVACDSYHKYKEDVQLMVDTGLEAYRFSISWSRLIPSNVLLPLSWIQPHVTLFHEDLPQILEDEYGGWLNRKAVKDFVAYADACFREFGDRVLYWTTFNEANIFALGGYDIATTPPGRCSSPFGLNCTKGNSTTEPYIVGHNLLLAHASAAKLYWKKYKAAQHGVIGINLFAFWFIPYTNSMEDKVATQRANDFYVGWMLNPLVFGDYPDIVKKNAGTRIPVFTRLESKQVKGSFDFLGVNHYNTLHIKDKSSSLEMETRDFIADMGAEIIFIQDDTPPDEFPIIPSGLHKLLGYFKHVYNNPPIYIHENGQRTKRNGTLDDVPRVKYLHGFIGSLLDAIRNGSNTRGYFVWSFLDMFELLGGYELAYGLYYVDLDDEDLTRYPKLSSRWYSNFLKGGNVSQQEVIQVANHTTSCSSQLPHFSQ